MIQPLWLSSIAKKAFLTELKSVDSFSFSIVSICFTYSATFCDFMEPDRRVEPPTELVSLLVLLVCMPGLIGEPLIAALSIDSLPDEDDSLAPR